MSRDPHILGSGQLAIHRLMEIGLAEVRVPFWKASDANLSNSVLKQQPAFNQLGCATNIAGRTFAGVTCSNKDASNRGARR